jgi:hypothetical protein
MIYSAADEPQAREQGMRSEERNEGDYRIYAGAVPAPRGQGYIATVVVKRVRGVQDGPRDVYRHDNLAGGHRWPSPAAARLVSVAFAQELIRNESYRLRG